MKVCDINSLTYIQDCKPFLNWFISNGEYILGLSIIFIGFVFLIIYTSKMKFVEELNEEKEVGK